MVDDMRPECILRVVIPGFALPGPRLGSKVFFGFLTAPRRGKFF